MSARLAASCAVALLALGMQESATGDDLRATGDSRSSAFEPGLVYNGAAFVNLKGGVRAGGTFSSNLNAQLDVDLDRLLGWPDTIGYLDALWLQGGLPSTFIGDAQGISGTSAPNTVKLYEAWLQKNLFDNRLSVLVGQYDLNSEFYRLQSAGLFFNSSFGIGPEFGLSGVEGPSVFPDTAVGMRLAFKSDHGLVARVAVLDGVPVDRPDGSRGVFEPGDGALLVAEVALLDRREPGDRPAHNRRRIGRDALLGTYESKLAVGAWYYTATFDDLSEVEPDGQPVRHRGSAGFYVLADRMLYRDPGPGGRTVFGFLELGLGDARVDRFGSYVGAGLTATGILARRPDDRLGLAIAYARNGSHYTSAQRAQGHAVTSAETAIELTYLIQVNARLALQPDLQYVISPNTTPAIPNGLAFQLRIEATF